MTEVEVLGRIRGTSYPDSLAVGSRIISVNGRGELIVAVGAPGMTETVRMGKTVSAFQLTAVAPVTALPTTSAPFSLYNNEPDGGVSYVIDEVFALVVTTAAAATGIQMCHMLGTGKKVAPTAAAITPRGSSGRLYGGRGIIALAPTVIDDGWMPVGSTNQAPSANQIGSAVNVDIGGRIIVPPGHMYSIGVLANTAVLITVRMGIRWHEMPAVLG